VDYSKFGKKRYIRRQNPHTTKIRNKVGLLALRLILGIILVAGFAGFSAVIGLYMGILGDAPELHVDMTVSVYQSSFIICAHTGEELVRLHAGHNHEFVEIDQIPLHVQNAFVAIEDERFWEHNGVDIRGIGRATHRLLESGGARTEGASTITQQLIKNMLDRFDSNFVYKLQEQYLAIRFERELAELFGCTSYAKEFILESYLNIINLGRSNYGVQAAAQFYYGVNVWELSIAQAATIAAITQNPSRFPPDRHPEVNWERATHVINSMLRLEFITEEEHYEAINSNVFDTIVRTDTGETRPIISPFDCFTNALLDAVRDDLRREFNLSREQANRQIFTGGLRIYSTQNREMQAAVDRVFLDDSYWPTGSDFSIDIEFHFSLYNSVTNQTRHYERRHSVANMAAAEAWMEQTLNRYMSSQDEVVANNPLFTPQPQGAFVLLDHHTGHVLALRGVRGESGANRTLNRATQSTRSPGSQLKTVGVFGPAFDIGIMQPGTIIIDQPFTHIDPWGATWTPSNHWPGFLGAQSVRTAVYRSGNVVSARAVADNTINNLGVDAMFSYLRNMGINTIVDGADGAAVSLGGMHRGVHLIELAGAYGMVANGGMFNAPVLYTMVIGPEGEVVLENPLNPTRVLRDTAAYLLIDTMRDTMRAANATGHNANWRDAPQMRTDIPIAGKTGTSQRQRDLGFSGSTPYFTASIWLGNDNNAILSRNARTHLNAWRSIMQEVHTGLPPRQFPRPTDGRIVTGTVCGNSGLLVSDACRGVSRIVTDLFDSRFLPTQICAECTPVTFTYCVPTGYLRGPHCRPSAVSTRSGANAHYSVNSNGFPQGVLDGIICIYCVPVPAMPDGVVSVPPSDSQPGNQLDSQPDSSSGNQPGLTLPPPPPVSNPND